VSPLTYELDFISQKTALFIVTAVKTSNLTSHVGVVAHTVTRGQVFSEYSGFPYPSFITPMLPSHHGVLPRTGTVGQ
jgi:hypothetical protein